MADQAAVDKVLAGERFFLGADLSGADFSGMNLSRRSFGKCDLSGADLAGADLRWCDFIGADLKGAKLDGADMHGSLQAGARIDSPTKTAADLLATIKAMMASVQPVHYPLTKNTNFYVTDGCTVLHGMDGSVYTLIFGDKVAGKADGQAEANPLSKQTWKWPIRFKLGDYQIDVPEPVADIQLGEE